MNSYGAGQSIDPHDQAMGSKLTCATIDSANKRYATAASLDHVVAKQINPKRQGAAGAVGRRGQHRDQGGPVVLGAGHRVPRDRQPADHLQPADGRVRHRRHRRRRDDGRGRLEGQAQAERPRSLQGRPAALPVAQDEQGRQDAGPELDGSAPHRRRPASAADDAHVVQHQATAEAAPFNARRRPTSRPPARPGRSRWAASSATRPTPSATRTSRRRSPRAATCS